MICIFAIFNILYLNDEKFLVVNHFCNVCVKGDKSNNEKIEKKV